MKGGNMKEIIGIRKRIFILIVAVLLVSATLIPGVIGKSFTIASNEDEKSRNLEKMSPLINLKERFNFIKSFQNIGRHNFGKPRSLSILNGVVHTNCNGVQESSNINFWSSKDIDVDKDPGTGTNGKDIRVRYLIAPWIDFSFDIGIGITFILTVERLGEEIKDRDFTVNFEILNNDINIGYRSRSDIENEIPDYTHASFTLYFYLFERTSGFEIAIKPEYNDGNEGKKIEIIAAYNGDSPQREVSIEFDPAIQFKAGFTTTKKQGVWDYKFYRESSDNSKVTSTFTTIENSFEKAITFTIDKIPKEMSFNLAITPFTQGGGQFLYESNEMYNIELQVYSIELGLCRYAFLKNTPRRIFAKWIPELINGEYHIEIDSEGSDFYLKDSEVDPIVNLKINGLENIDIDAYWNLTNPGDFTVYKNNDLNVELDFNIESWVAQLTAEPIAQYISTTWDIALTGYITFDTNWQPFSQFNLLIRGALAGLHINSQTFKSEDFNVYWTLWPPQDAYVYYTGWINFLTIAIDVYLFNQWLHLWPW
jgi:hypothetical protein